MRKTKSKRRSTSLDHRAILEAIANDPKAGSTARVLAVKQLIALNSDNRPPTADQDEFDGLDALTRKAIKQMRSNGHDYEDA